ncbi:hypothetical protein Salat_2960200 [Sesamum alatum]|uniref:Uncharacterized protein n=1 Tax=Sesamum alatum TaxID=300844 RepID=A0AAE2C7Y4_9LAMI|nr:hypothetical protein Salat_2960200 [Sesamum alatum]
MVGFKQEFNISEFFTLASRVFDKGDVQAMAAMKNLQDAWRLQFGEEVSPPPQTSMADPSWAVALKPTSAHVLTPFRLPKPEIRRARRVLSRDSAVTFDIPPTTSTSFQHLILWPEFLHFALKTFRLPRLNTPLELLPALHRRLELFALIFRLTLQLPHCSNSDLIHCSVLLCRYPH